MAVGLPIYHASMDEFLHRISSNSSSSHPFQSALLCQPGPPSQAIKKCMKWSSWFGHDWNTKKPRAGIPAPRLLMSKLKNAQWGTVLSAHVWKQTFKRRQNLLVIAFEPSCFDRGGCTWSIFSLFRNLYQHQRFWPCVFRTQLEKIWYWPSERSARARRSQHIEILEADTAQGQPSRCRWLGKCVDAGPFLLHGYDKTAFFEKEHHHLYMGELAKNMNNTYIYIYSIYIYCIQVRIGHYDDLISWLAIPREQRTNSWRGIPLSVHWKIRWAAELIEVGPRITKNTNRSTVRWGFGIYMDLWCIMMYP